MVFFDPEEHQNLPTDEPVELASIPKLGAEWKIIHEFKPTEYFKPGDRHLGLGVIFGMPARRVINLLFYSSKIVLRQGKADDMLSLKEILTDNPSASCVASSQPPEVGEWTRIEISHEEVDGHYSLSLAVGGSEVGRMEDYLSLGQLNLVKVVIGGGGPEFNQPGLLRRLVILEKQ